MDTNYSQLIPAIILGIGGMILGVQQLVKKFKATDAETSILGLLHSELESLAAQNKLLSSYVHQLQLEAVKINCELGKMQVENRKLHAEVICLTREITSLQVALNRGTT